MAMLLPDYARTVIDEAKLVDYLLNASHPDNGGKAAFFERWGFNRGNSEVLVRAIRGMIGCTEVARHESSKWGEKFIVDGPLDSPRGPTPVVRTVWIVDALHEAPRLVTAYPRRKG